MESMESREAGLQPSHTLGNPFGLPHSHGLDRWHISKCKSKIYRIQGLLTIGLEQAPMAVMIENGRTGLIWRYFPLNLEVAHLQQRIG
jgi:hypothetical protein